MHKLFLAAAFAGLACTARAETLWVAEARVIAVTAQCSNTVSVGDFFRAIYRPMGATIGNGAYSHLALFSQRTSFVMRVPNNSFRGNVNYVGQVISASNSVTSHGGGILAWTESVAFGGGTAASSVSTSLANFYGTTGCTATLRMPFTLLP